MKKKKLQLDSIESVDSDNSQQFRKDFSEENIGYKNKKKSLRPLKLNRNFSNITLGGNGEKDKQRSLFSTQSTFYRTRPALTQGRTIKEKVENLLFHYSGEARFIKEKEKIKREDKVSKGKTKVYFTNKQLNKINLEMLNAYSKKDQIHVVSDLYTKILIKKDKSKPQHSKRKKNPKAQNSPKKELNSTTKEMTRKFLRKTSLIMTGENSSKEKIRSKTRSKTKKKTHYRGRDNFALSDTSAMTKMFMRDFGMSRGKSEIAISKRNQEMVDNFMEKRKSIFLTRSNEISANFEKLKKREINLSNYNYNETCYDKLGSDKNKWDDKVSEFEYRFVKNRHEILTQKKLEQESKKFADLFIDLNYMRYEKNKIRNKFNEVSINYNNLLRKIKVNYIKKNQVNMDDEEKVNVQKFKKVKQETDDEVLYAMSKLGPPGFVKKKFRDKTAYIFRIVDGVFMGVPV